MEHEYEQIAKMLEQQASKYSSLVARMQQLASPSLMQKYLMNFAIMCWQQLKRLQQYIPCPNDQVAWGARNLFETNILLRWCLQSEENMKAWHAQRAYDEIEIYEGIIKINSSAPGIHKEVIQQRVIEIQDWLTKAGLPRMRKKRVYDLAEDVGVKDEYEAFYKLYSKYVHPSSFLLNADNDSVNALHFFYVLVMQGQLYAGDSFYRIEGAFLASLESKTT